MSTTGIVIVAFTFAGALWVSVVTALDSRRHVSREVARRHQRGTVGIWLVFVIAVIKLLTHRFH